MNRHIYTIEEIIDLLEENEKLKQWDKNKDTRNSRQRVANKQLIKENKQLKKENEIMIGAVKILDQMSKAKILTFDKETLTVTFNYDEASTFIDNQNKYLTQKLKASEQEKENLIQYLENKINICNGFLDTIKTDLKNTNISVGAEINLTNQRIKHRNAIELYQKILEKIKSDKYE